MSGSQSSGQYHHFFKLLLTTSSQVTVIVSVFTQKETEAQGDKAHNQEVAEAGFALRLRSLP